MRAFLKKLVVDTPLEVPARRLWNWIGMHRSHERPQRDNLLATEIVARVLGRDSNCVDIGSSCGDYLRTFLRFAPRGQHFAFEPIPARVADLRRNFPRVRVFDVALSDTAGESEFHQVVDDTGYSGLKRRSYPRSDWEVKRIQVRVETLDGLLPAAVKIALIKIDVEGAELQVLRGAARTVQASRPFILFEHGLGSAEHYGTTPEMVYDLLAGEYDLRVSLLEDWLRGRPPLTRDEFRQQFHSGQNCNFLAHP